MASKAGRKARKARQKAAKAATMEIRKPCEIAEAAQSEGVAVAKQAKNWGLLGWWKRPKKVRSFLLGTQFVEIRQHGNCIEIAGLTQAGTNRHMGRFGKLTHKLESLGFVWVRNVANRKITGWVLDCRENGWNQQPWLAGVWEGLEGDESDRQFGAVCEAARVTQHTVGRYIGM